MLRLLKKWFYAVVKKEHLMNGTIGTIEIYHKTSIEYYANNIRHMVSYGHPFK
jgi:hypothetical protein